jgi:hypothetical protein
VSGENNMMRSLMIVLLTKYLWDDKIENEMGGVFSAQGEERCIQGIGGETSVKETTCGDPGVDGRIILRWIFRKWGVVLWTGSSWLRIVIGGGHL